MYEDYQSFTKPNDNLSAIFLTKTTQPSDSILSLSPSPQPSEEVLQEAFGFVLHDAAVYLWLVVE